MKPSRVMGEFGITTYEGHPADYKPEPTREQRAAEKAADRLELKDLQRASGLTVDELNHAITAWGFPKPITTDVGGFGRPQYVRSYSKSSIREWRARFAPLAQKLINTKF